MTFKNIKFSVKCAVNFTPLPILILRYRNATYPLAESNGRIPFAIQDEVDRSSITPSPGGKGS
jgi:hypothetical protein